MTTGDRKILTTIKRLLAHADSARQLGSQAEAEAFAAKAQELLTAHKLEASDVEIAALDEEDPIGREHFDVAEHVEGIAGGRRDLWIEQLAVVVAHANFCKLMLAGGKRLRVIGRRSDREVFCYVFQVLVREGDRLSLKHYHEVHRAYRAGELAKKPFRAQRSFRLGFVDGIRARLRESQKVAEQAAGTRAIVLHDARKAVELWYQKNERPGTRSSGFRNDGVDSRSYAAGQAAGRSASWSQGVGGKSSPRLSLGPGGR